ncbi:hypothetical protein BofuT4_P154460.1 [Botrytis cinerea T4]|uniref:Uncharacterized protein n=1 Tax=Botryotinia fuckeliana (strain T4) TaxID=999810 RepID=G2YVI6_BOTF4|nr:hypothetical protein BofuT4_P154460.1 [Botrytis cinerea T4]
MDDGPVSHRHVLCFSEVRGLSIGTVLSVQHPVQFQSVTVQPVQSYSVQATNLHPDPARPEYGKIL